MIKYPKFFFSNLMKQSKISIGSETDQSANFIADIFDRIKICNSNFDWFRVNESKNLNLYFFSIFSEFSLFLSIFNIMKQISS